MQPTTASFIHSFRYPPSDTPPKITPLAPSPFPRVSIRNTKSVSQPRFLVLYNIRRLRIEAHARIWLSARLVQDQLQRVTWTPCREIRSGKSVPSSAYTVGDGGGDGGVVLCDEIAPDGHEGFVEVGPLVWGWRTEVGGQIGCVPGADDGVLVFVSCVGVVGVCEGFREPICRADEGCLRVDVLGETSVLFGSSQ